MYCERIDNSSGISLKQCHRLKAPKVSAKQQQSLLLTHAYSLTQDQTIHQFQEGYLDPYQQTSFP